MNLRGFHAFLIFLAAALAVVFGVWCLRRYSLQGSAAFVIAGIVSFAISAGLVAYDSWFLRKTRGLR